MPRRGPARRRDRSSETLQQVGTVAGYALRALLRRSQAARTTSPTAKTMSAADSQRRPAQAALPPPARWVRRGRTRWGSS